MANFLQGERVQATFYGEEQTGTVERNQTSVIVFVLWDKSKRVRWTHAESLTRIPDFDNASSADLNAWYKRTVGYAPQEDCPDMPDSELRELCKSYHDGMVHGFD